MVPARAAGGPALADSAYKLAQQQRCAVCIRQPCSQLELTAAAGSGRQVAASAAAAAAPEQDSDGAVQCSHAEPARPLGCAGWLLLCSHWAHGQWQDNGCDAGSQQRQPQAAFVACSRSGRGRGRQRWTACRRAAELAAAPSCAATAAAAAQQAWCPRGWPRCPPGAPARHFTSATPPPTRPPPPRDREIE